MMSEVRLSKDHALKASMVVSTEQKYPMSIRSVKYANGIYTMEATGDAGFMDLVSQYVGGIAAREEAAAKREKVGKR